MSDEKNTQENEELEVAEQETIINAESAESEVTETASVEEQLEHALADVAQMKDQMIREQAETQNIRKRLQGDVEKARKFALERFINELLPVADNLDRAIDAVGDDEATKPFLEGVELTRKNFLDILQKFNVEQVNPVGEPFDPQFHEAVTMVPNPNMEPNSVMDVMQKGYTLNGRLLRAAMVVVSKAP
jgi:molecular chaperone GrpE